MQFQIKVTQTHTNAHAHACRKTKSCYCWLLFFKMQFIRDFYMQTKPEQTRPHFASIIVIIIAREIQSSKIVTKLFNRNTMQLEIQ